MTIDDPAPDESVSLQKTFDSPEGTILCSLGRKPVVYTQVKNQRADGSLAPLSHNVAESPFYKWTVIRGDIVGERGLPSSGLVCKRQGANTR